MMIRDKNKLAFFYPSLYGNDKFSIPVELPFSEGYNSEFFKETIKSEYIIEMSTNEIMVFPEIKNKLKECYLYECDTQMVTKMQTMRQLKISPIIVGFKRRYLYVIGGKIDALSERLDVVTNKWAVINSPACQFEFSNGIGINILDA